MPLTLSNFKTFQLENLSAIKGGFRYVTQSESSFESKRNQLQNKGESMNITHNGNYYCIEW